MHQPTQHPVVAATPVLYWNKYFFLSHLLARRVWIIVIPLCILKHELKKRKLVNEDLIFGK